MLSIEMYISGNRRCPEMRCDSLKPLEGERMCGRTFSAGRSVKQRTLTETEGGMAQY